MPGTAARRTATGTRRTTGTPTSAFGLPELRRWSGCFARRNRPLFPFRYRRCVADKSLPCPRPVLVASAKALDGPFLRKRWALPKTCRASRSRATASQRRPLTTGPGATSHPPIPGRSDRPSPADPYHRQWAMAVGGLRGNGRFSTGGSITTETQRGRAATEEEKHRDTEPERKDRERGSTGSHAFAAPR